MITGWFIHESSSLVIYFANEAPTVCDVSQKIMDYSHATVITLTYVLYYFRLTVARELYGERLFFYIKYVGGLLVLVAWPVYMFGFGMRYVDGEIIDNTCMYIKGGKHFLRMLVIVPLMSVVSTITFVYPFIAMRSFLSPDLIKAAKRNLIANFIGDTADIVAHALWYLIGLYAERENGSNYIRAITTVCALDLCLNYLSVRYMFVALYEKSGTPTTKPSSKQT